MAGTILQGFEFKGGVGRVGGRKHNWVEVLDGQVRQFGPGEMGGAKPSTFVAQARTQAKKRGLSLRSSLDKDEQHCVIQAVPKQAALEVSQPQGSEEDTTSTSEQGNGAESEVVGESPNGEAVEQHEEPVVERTESTKTRKKREREEAKAKASA